MFDWIFYFILWVEYNENVILKESEAINEIRWYKYLDQLLSSLMIVFINCYWLRVD